MGQLELEKWILATVIMSVSIEASAHVRDVKKTTLPPGDRGKVSVDRTVSDLSDDVTAYCEGEIVDRLDLSGVDIEFSRNRFREWRRAEIGPTCIGSTMQQLVHWDTGGTHTHPDPSPSPSPSPSPPYPGGDDWDTG